MSRCSASIRAPQERLESFEQAVRQVYASTMDISALEYRRLRGLEDKDEQMAILIQRVSGSWYGRYFMPDVAGVGYSYSAYKWYRDIDPAAGMPRLVMGLGTRAGYNPELSYGSHIFQDLVEAEILYGEVWNNEKTLVYRPEALNGLPDLFPEICPDLPTLAGMIRAAETPGLRLWQDAVSGRAVCGWE